MSLPLSEIRASCARATCEISLSISSATDDRKINNKDKQLYHVKDRFSLYMTFKYTVLAPYLYTDQDSAGEVANIILHHPPSADYSITVYS